MRAWSEIASGARFVRAMLMPRGGLPAPRWRVLAWEDERLGAQVYAPWGPVKGTIVWFYGMTPLGVHDPRSRALCQALARCGYRVVSPELPEITSLRVDPTTIDRMEGLIAAVAGDPRLAPGRVGVMAISFSGSLALAAAARPAIRDRVSAVLLLGAYADPRSTMRRLMADDVNAYGRLILFRNFLQLAVGGRPGVEGALDAAILDNWHGRTGAAAHLPQVLASLADADRVLLDHVLGPAATRAPLAAILLDRLDPLFDQLRLDQVARSLRCPVVLVHGVHDEVIPPEQSELLASLLTQAGRRNRLVLTPLVSHGNQRLGPAQALHLPRLGAAFGSFLQEVARARPLVPLLPELPKAAPTATADVA